MPNILDPVKWRMPTYDFHAQDYGYDYPNGLNLKPGTTLHDEILSNVMRRATASANQMRKRYPDWRLIDEKMTAYINLDTDEEDIKDDDSRKPVSIVFPHSYAIMETLLAYMLAAFIQKPIFMYEGTGPDDIYGAIMMELLVGQQTERSKVALNLHTFFSDSFKYGFSVGHPYWEKQAGLVRRTVEIPSMMTFLTGNVQKEIEEVEDIIFEGNALSNIDPYKYLPDPDVPVHEPQKGEFVGWSEESRYVALLEEERYDSEMFNAKYVKHTLGRRTNVFSTDESGRNRRTSMTKSEDMSIISPIDKINMYINLLPEEWKIGDGEYPEKWIFTIVNDSVIVKARPIGLTHGKFPIVVAAPETDGYTLSPLSRIEMIYGMQSMLDWMMNTHVANVRKAINDQLVVDPSLINMPDIKESKAGGLIRLRRTAWGRGVKDAIQQLPITDVTRGHVADAGMLAGLMQMISGADDASMGNLRQGGPERLTATEFQGTRVGSVSRFERIARIMSLQGMTDLGYMFASHAQQLTSRERYAKTMGRWGEVLAKEYGVETNRVLVSPFDLQVDYDIAPRDGSVPGGNFSGVWTKLFEIIGTTPELLQQFDIVRIFTHIARDLGAKDVEAFKRKEGDVGTASLDTIERGEQSGNLVPIRAAGGGR